MQNRSVQEIGSFGERKSKLLEMAQTILAEKAPQLSNSASASTTSSDTGNVEAVSGARGQGPVDRSQLSQEAVEELKSKGSEAGGADTMVNALRQIFDQKLDQNGQGQQPQQVGGAGEGGGAEGKGKTKKKVERKLEWTPDTKKGQIHPGRDVIGQARIKEKITEEPDDQTVNGAQKGTAASSKGNQSGGGAAPAKEGQQSQGNDGNRQDDKTQQDKVEISPESANMASKMNAAGLQAPAEVQGQGGASPVSEAGESKKGGGAGQGQSKERVVFEGEVRTRATGTTQSVDVTPAGELPPGKPFRTFQKLDDMPMLEHATLHGKDGKEFLADHQRRKMRGEAVEPLPEELIQKLKHPVAS